MFPAYAVDKPKGKFRRIDCDPGALGPEQVEIDVIACGLCRSDLAMIDNLWRDSDYPLVPGHEIIGTVARCGVNVKHLRTGDTVGVGWFSGSCMTCFQCLSGNHNLCAHVEQTIIGRHGGFAAKLRCAAVWATPLPAGLNARSAGPLLCGGVTVFNPLVQFDVKPTQRAGVVGIGGLGHLALQFLNKWGCEVTAFTSSADKHAAARGLGAHHVVDSRSSKQIAKLAGALDFILITVDVELDWSAYLAALAPKGRLHFVGVVPAPIALPKYALIAEQHSVSGSPTGSPAVLRAMLDFCARHRIEPVVEHFPMSRVDDAVARLRSGKARFRVVLENDFS